MYFGEQCTLYSNMLKQFKTEKATTGRFSLSMVSFCRNFLALYIWWRLRLHLHLCRKRRNIVSVNFQGFRYKSRTGSHSVVLEHPGTSWFLLCFRKRVLLLNLVLYDPSTLRRRLYSENTSNVFKISPDHLKTKSRRFLIPLV